MSVRRVRNVIEHLMYKSTRIAKHFTRKTFYEHNQRECDENFDLKLGLREVYHFPLRRNQNKALNSDAHSWMHEIFGWFLFRIESLSVIAQAHAMIPQFTHDYRLSSIRIIYELNSERSAMCLASYVRISGGTRAILCLSSDFCAPQIESIRHK